MLRHGIALARVEQNDQVPAPIVQHRNFWMRALEQATLLDDQEQHLILGRIIPRGAFRLQAGRAEPVPRGRMGTIGRTTEVLAAEFEPPQAVLVEQLGPMCRRIGRPTDGKKHLSSLPAQTPDAFTLCGFGNVMSSKRHSRGEVRYPK
jgi:hypothetical protein